LLVDKVLRENPFVYKALHPARYRLCILYPKDWQLLGYVLVEYPVILDAFYLDDLHSSAC